MHLQEARKSCNIIPTYGYEVSHHIYKNWCSTSNTGLHPMRIANQGTPLQFMTSFPSYLTLQLSLWAVYQECLSVENSETDKTAVTMDLFSYSVYQANYLSLIFCASYLSLWISPCSLPRATLEILWLWTFSRAFCALYFWNCFSLSCGIPTP